MSSLYVAQSELSASTDAGPHLGLDIYVACHLSCPVQVCVLLGWGTLGGDGEGEDNIFFDFISLRLASLV